MSDIEEEQPTQEPGRRDWNQEGDETASLRGDTELGGRRNLFEEHSVTGSRRLSGGAQLAGPKDEDRKPEVTDDGAKGKKIEGDCSKGCDKNPGADLSREPDEESESDE
jgi:hypothetical protein